jgi:hypothetical protein
MVMRKNVYTLILIVMGIGLAGCSLTVPKSTNPIEPEAAFWQQLGESWNYGDTGSPTPYALALDNSDRPMVAYIKNPNFGDNSQPTGIYVRRWDESNLNWSYYGSNNDPLGCFNSCQSIDLAVNPTNSNPVLAWIDNEDASIAYPVYVKRWTGTTWEEYVTGPLNSNDAFHVEVAVGSDGNPVVAWVETNGDGGFLLYVRKWNGSVWANIDTNGYNINNFSFTDIRDISLALDSSNNPVVAWSEQAEYDDGAGNFFLSYDISIKHFDGTNWANYGSGGPLDVVATDDAISVSLALLDNNPIVVWDENQNTPPEWGNLYAKQWDGSSWISYGPLDIDLEETPQYPSIATRNGVTFLSWQENFKLQVKKLQGSSLISYGSVAAYFWRASENIAINNAGNPVIASSVATIDDLNQLSVYQWRTNSWQPLGNELDTTPSDNASKPSIDLRTDNNPVVAWGENGNIYAKQWDSNGSSWFNLGGAIEPIAGNSASDPSLAVDNNNFDRPYVALVENDGTSDGVYVQKFDDGVWLDVGSALDNNLSQNANQPSLAIRGSFAPHVAFSESDGTSSNIYVKQFDGNDWQAVGGALDKTLANNASNPSLALDSTGKPVVAWQEVVSGSSNIYVKRWSGSVWVLLKTYLDISVANNAVTPSLALRPDNQPVVAWSENGNIYVKRWAGSTTGNSSTGSWAAYTSNTDITPADVSVANNAIHPHLLLSGTQPLVAFEEDGNVFVRRWRGATLKWATISPGAADRTLANQASHPVIALQSIPGVRPIVAWQEDTGASTDVFVSRF